MNPATSPTTAPPAPATGGSGVLDDLDLKLARETLADRMTTQLRQQILSGRLRPGDLVPTERELREAFGVSRATVREALHGLVASGFLERRSNQLFVRDRREIPDYEVDYAELAARRRWKTCSRPARPWSRRRSERRRRTGSTGTSTSSGPILDRMRPGVGAELPLRRRRVPHGDRADLPQRRVAAGVRELQAPLLPPAQLLADLRRPRPGDTARAITGFEGHAPLVDAIARRDADEAVRRNDELLDRVATTLVQRLSSPR